MPELCCGTVMDNKRLNDTAHMLTVEAGHIAARAAPGQFVHIRCGEGTLLRRPVSIAGAAGTLLTLVVEARGMGTAWLTSRRTGDTLDILGPLGRGFDLVGGRLLLVGGGIGVPPLLFAARRAKEKPAAILGFKNESCVILAEEFHSVCDSVAITTEDGSLGEEGLVTAPLRRLLDRGFDGVLACGPRPMLNAVAELAACYNVPCQVSMEERMGCGIGACLVCACKTRKGGVEHMRHVCKDGPVFRAEEVVW